CDEYLLRCDESATFAFLSLMFKNIRKFEGGPVNEMQSRLRDVFAAAYSAVGIGFHGSGLDLPLVTVEQAGGSRWDRRAYQSSLWGPDVRQVAPVANRGTMLGWLGHFDAARTYSRSKAINALHTQSGTGAQSIAERSCNVNS